MARAVLHLTAVFDETATSLEDTLVKDGDNVIGVQELASHLASLMAKGGRVIARIDSSDSVAAGDRATATITITHGNVGTDGVTIGGVSFTEGTDWDAGADAGEDADNLAAAINADATIGKLVEAVSDGTDTVTLTYWGYGRDGELVELSTDDGTAYSLSASALALASNTDTAVSDGVEYRVGL